MSGLLIKDFPPELHRGLKEEVSRYHRSMTRQALLMLEQALAAPARNAANLLPEPLKSAKPIRAEAVVEMIRERRDREDVRPLAKIREPKRRVKAWSPPVIVIDANIPVYSLIECDSTPLAQELRVKRICLLLLRRQRIIVSPVMMRANISLRASA